MTARTPSAGGAHPAASRSASTLLVLTAAALLGGIAGAAPAAAVHDPAAPAARVTHGPSCHPGGVAVQVTAGTAPYAVVLATTRTPGGEDSAELAAGETVALRTDDVAWGETIDGRLEFAALDGSGKSFVDELEGYTFTRPAEEDCAAIAAPAAVATVPPTTGGSAAGGTSATAEEGTAAGASVELVEAASPVATPTASGPMLAAALALAGAVAGLGGVMSRSVRAGRRPTSSG